MNDVTKVPERKLRHETASGARKDSGDRAPCPEAPASSAYNPASGFERACPWPFKMSDTSPLAWWRTLPSDVFRGTERLILLTTLEQIDVLHGGADFTAALEGDLSSAIGVAFSLMPIEEMTLKVDIAMTALLQCALEPNSTAALVLAQVLGLTDVGHPVAAELAASWFAYGRRYSTDPRKFSEAEAVLLVAFRERRRDGDDE
jgi:hypothetical protein